MQLIKRMQQGATRRILSFSVLGSYTFRWDPFLDPSIGKVRK